MQQSTARCTPGWKSKTSRAILCLEDAGRTAASSCRTRRTQPLDKGAGFWLFQCKFSSEARSWLGLPCHVLQRKKGFPAGNRLQEWVTAPGQGSGGPTPPFLLLPVLVMLPRHMGTSDCKGKRKSVAQAAPPSCWPSRWWGQDPTTNSVTRELFAIKVLMTSFWPLPNHFHVCQEPQSLWEFGPNNRGLHA